VFLIESAVTDLVLLVMVTVAEGDRPTVRRLQTHPAAGVDAYMGRFGAVA